MPHDIAGWRYLDTGSAVTGAAEQTVYAPDRILVAGHDRELQLELLRTAARRRGWSVEPDPRFGRGGTLPAQEEALTRLIIVPGPGAPDPDAFDLLELVREDDLIRVGRRESAYTPVDEYDDPALERRDHRRTRNPVTPDLPSSRVRLDHAVFLSAFQPLGKGIYGTNGKGIYGSNGKGIYGTNGSPADSYAFPGEGGRSPVAVVIDAPERGHEPRRGRRPAIGYLDSGCGKHPWLTDVVRDLPGPGGHPVAPRVAAFPSPEEVADQTGPLDGELDAISGHGTFIAGVLRQSAPRADVYSWRVVTSYGIVAESELTAALEAVADLVASGALALDVLSLSLGFYPEREEDPENDQVLRPTLARFTGLGVSVVCSAGNEATDRELYPAAHAARPPAGAPFLSVGARNPNGTIALFSNIGDWVTCYETGAALVSTAPPLQGGRQPLSRVAGSPASGGIVRETLDPDCFHAASSSQGGFAVWSGTSFAAPRLAGRLARALEELPADLDPVERAWAALKSIG